MLEPDEVDDGYFTPVASTTLASIFKEDSNNDAAVNPSLKYKPPLLKKAEESNKHDEATASQCVFSCSIIAYEWVQGTHKCKGKIGFAMMKIVKTGLCKIILYSPDKSTLSCTTITPQLEVTISSGAMISFYDDHKKYWGLCFNDKNIERLKEFLRIENVAIKPYITPEFKPEIEMTDSDETTDETGNSSTTEEDTVTSTSQINKASILNRIANVGHAILPSLPISPKKTTTLEVAGTTDLFSSPDKLNKLPDVGTTKEYDNAKAQELTQSIALPTSLKNDETNNMASSKKVEHSQTSVTSLPLVNNQLFTYVNGYMVPLHMQIPVLGNTNSADTCAEIELIIHKLTYLKSVVRTMETKQLQNIEKLQSDLVLNKISNLEQSIKEKNETITHLVNEKKDLCNHINNLNDQVQKSVRELEKNKIVLDKEILNRKVKTLMNDTFHSLVSNFDDEEIYSGNHVKGILATVIKKITIESLVNLFPNDVSVSNKAHD